MRALPLLLALLASPGGAISPGDSQNGDSETFPAVPNKGFPEKTSTNVDYEAFKTGRRSAVRTVSEGKDGHQITDEAKSVKDSANKTSTLMLHGTVSGMGEGTKDKLGDETTVTEEQIREAKRGVMTEMSEKGALTPKTALGAAEVFSKAGQPKEAERLYKAALRGKPDDPSALAGLALVQAQQGRGPESVETAKRALALDPENKLAKLVAGHGDSLAQGGGAFQHVGRPGWGPAEEPGSRKAAGEGRPAAAGPAAPSRGTASAPAAAPAAPAAAPAPRPLYDLARPLTPAQQLVMKALEKQALGDSRGALLLLSQAMDADPGDAGAYVVRAEVGNALGNFAGAAADAGKALELSPNDAVMSARALRARSFARLDGGDPAGALADAEAALRLEPGSGLGRLYRAMALARLGRLAEARADAEEALRLDPGLAPLAQPLLGQPRPAPAAPPAAALSLRRAAPIALALLLILAGLAGTAGGRRLTTTAARALGGARGEAPPPAAEFSAELSAGDLVGGTYRIVRELGRGGMGVVYEAQDETLQRRVAIKRMRGGEGADLQRFLREARLVAQLKHPHLAEIYNVVVQGQPLLVFEYVDGRGLDAVLAAGGPLAVGKARRAVAEICAALQYAHGRNIIHRDLKPSNVMLAADGACKVMDFGIAHQSRGVSTMTQTAVCGTPAYMAPEQGFGSVSKASDLYALGVMTYELLTGARPFEREDFVQAKLESRFRPATQVSPALPKSVDAFFARALAAEPAKRFASADELRLAFESALDGTPAPIA